MDGNNTVYIRPLSIEDTELIIGWRNKKEVYKYFIYQKKFTVKGHLEWYTNNIQTGKAIQFIIVHSESQKPIGSVYLRDIDYENNKAEFGIFIGEPSYMGNGYGTKATKLLLDYAFKNMNLHRIYLRVFSDNKRAISSYEKAGFKSEGTFQDDVRVEGRYRSIVWMAIINQRR